MSQGSAYSEYSDNILYAFRYETQDWSAKAEWQYNFLLSDAELK